jgi:cytoskeletal protein CcmA (bactofilin family)
MSIVNIKSKLAAAAQNGSSGEITKKLEILSANFKTTPTIIAKDMLIEGSLKTDGILEIQGSVKGIISGNSVILREECFVEGSITAESLSIRGRFEGSIKAKKINVSSRGRVFGEIEYDSLSVEDGACLDGQFKRLKNPD